MYRISWAAERAFWKQNAVQKSGVSMPMALWMRERVAESRAASYRTLGVCEECSSPQCGGRGQQPGVATGWFPVAGIQSRCFVVFLVRGTRNQRAATQKSLSNCGMIERE